MSLRSSTSNRPLWTSSAARSPSSPSRNRQWSNTRTQQEPQPSSVSDLVAFIKASEELHARPSSPLDPTIEQPINDIAQALHSKYAAMAQQHQSSLQELKMSLEQSQSECRALQTQLIRKDEAAQHFKAQFHKLRSAVDNDRARVILDKQTLEANVSRLESRVRELNEKLERTGEKSQQDNLSHQLQVDKMQSELSKEKEKSAALQEKLTHTSNARQELEMKLLEMKNSDGQSTLVAEKEEQIKTLKEANMALDIAVQKAEAASRQAQAEIVKYRSLYEQQISLTEEVRAQSKKIQEDLLKANRRWEENERRGEVWSVELARIRRELEDAQRLSKASTLEIQQRDSVIVSLREQAITQKVRIETREDELNETRSTLNATQQEVTQLSQQLVEARAATAAMQEQLLDTRAELEGCEQAADALVAQRDSLTQQLDDLSRRLEANKHLSNLDPSQMQRVLQSNLQMAASIQGLLQTGKALPFS